MTDTTFPGRRDQSEDARNFRLDWTDREANHSALQIARQPNGGSAEAASDIEHMRSGTNIRLRRQPLDQGDLGFLRIAGTLPKAVVNMVAPECAIEGRQPVIMPLYRVDLGGWTCTHLPSKLHALCQSAL